MRSIRSAAALLAGVLLAGVAVLPPTARAQAPTSVTVRSDSGDITVVADRLEEVAADHLLIATGNVEVTRGSQRLTADRVEVNRATGDTVAEGRAVFYDGEDRLIGPRIEYNFKTGSGVVYEGLTRTSPFYRVGGERMERLAEGRYRVRRGIFTTCEDDPPTWSFHFGSANADLESLIYGTEASFWVKNVPLVPFFPFFAAAIRRERQTGFLFPRIGSTTRKGNFAEIPFFWAISDSQDVTFTLDVYDHRGVGANWDYRYILSDLNRGSFAGFYINEFRRDQPAGPGIDDNRAWWSLRHDWTIGGGWGLKADINGVSDDLVLREYADRLQLRSLQRAESNVFITRSWPTATLTTNLFWYQDLTTDRPVELQRLPDIRYIAPRQPIPGLPTEWYVLGEVEARATNFVRDVGSDGRRIDLHPRVSHTISPGGYFSITPFVGGRLTAYDKTVTGTRVTRNGGFTVEITEDEPRLRRLAELGADFEARASRIYQLGNVAGIDAVLHSIEPRLNYTWIDGSDLLQPTGQGDFRRHRLPIWDDVDQVAKTSAFTYSLTNRLRARTVAPPGTEATRWELARLVLGQSYDLYNDVRPFSNVTADLIVDPLRYFSFRATGAYNVYGEGLKSLTTDLAVTTARVEATVGTRVSRERVLNAAGEFENRATDEFLQGRIRAIVFPWLVARVETNWDLKEDVFVENRYGADLRWQCWALTVEYVTRNADENEIRFALNLLGVGTPLQFGGSVGAITGSTTGAGRIR
jgi:LPS-assembly protein